MVRGQQTTVRRLARCGLGAPGDRERARDVVAAEWGEEHRAHRLSLASRFETLEQRGVKLLIVFGIVVAHVQGDARAEHALGLEAEVLIEEGAETLDQQPRSH